MRVGLRRLRSALRAFRALVPKAAAKPLVKRLRALMPSLGAARDWDVFCEGIVGVSTQAPERAPAMAALLARARGKRSVARRRARLTASSPKLQAFLLRALRWVTDAPWRSRAAGAERSLARFAIEALDGLHAPALKQARGIDWGNAERRHRLRIRMKRLRYACDFFAPSFPGAAARPYLKRLGALQDILGDLNDIAVARRLLSEIGVRRARSRAAKLAPRGSDATVVAAAARVRQTLAERERTLVASLEPAWATFEKRRPFWRLAR
jgi:CHAD domain-containing protein